MRFGASSPICQQAADMGHSAGSEGPGLKPAVLGLGFPGLKAGTFGVPALCADSRDAYYPRISGAYTFSLEETCSGYELQRCRRLFGS
jgi:hypothetical protein